ncbi:MAG: LytR/AlgR family response regulator transcription factor [Bryobacteraceae bacterium]
MQSRATGTISAILVDDESPARDELAFLLNDFPEVEVVGSAGNGLEALETITRLRPDVVFLDVQMPGLDGTAVIREVREAGGRQPYFILTTAYEQYAIEAFRLEALDYLLKPVDRDRLALSIERAQRSILDRGKPPETPARPPAQRTKVLLKCHNRNLIVDPQEIIYATIDDGLITIVTSQLEGVSNYRTIEELQSNLDPEIFWRVHRSYLVNINRIKEVIPWFKSSFQIRMDDKKGTEVPVSRVQTKRLRALLKL